MTQPKQLRQTEIQKTDKQTNRQAGRQAGRQTTYLTVLAFGIRNSPGSSTSAVDVVKLLRKRHLSSNKNELADETKQNGVCYVSEVTEINQDGIQS